MVKTLKHAWFDLMKDILAVKSSNVVEDYIELVGANTVFSFENLYELNSDKRILDDFSEMKKVFFTNKENIFGHSYGDAILTPYSNIKNPVEAITHILTKNPNTRKAVLTFVPYGEEKVPCISTVQFLLRDNKINIFYTSRSQDIYRKFPCDAMCIASFGEEIAKNLNVELGSIYANIISAHIYLKDIENAQEYLKL